jgi:hypothetical protein
MSAACRLGSGPVGERSAVGGRSSRPTVRGSPPGVSEGRTAGNGTLRRFTNAAIECGWRQRHGWVRTNCFCQKQGTVAAVTDQDVVSVVLVVIEAHLFVKS